MIFSPLNPPIRDWRGKRVWLVGASSGIGLALAEHLYKQGARVVISARKQERLQTWVAAHTGALARAMDVCDAAQSESIAHNVIQEWGGIDCLFYCAAHYAPHDAMGFGSAEMQRHMQVNYNGLLPILQPVIEQMLRQGHGHLSLIASVAGYRGLPQSLAYGPTKAALQNLADSLYLDLHPKGIGVSVINPGFVATDLTAKNDFSMPALLLPEDAARYIAEGMGAGVFEIHFPRRFTIGLKILQMLPHRVYFWATSKLQTH